MVNALLEYFEWVSLCESAWFFVTPLYIDHTTKEVKFALTTSTLHVSMSLSLRGMSHVR